LFPTLALRASCDRRQGPRSPLRAVAVVPGAHTTMGFADAMDLDPRLCFLQLPIWDIGCGPACQVDREFPQCTYTEAVAEWSWLSFRVLMALTTSVHIVVQRIRGWHMAQVKASERYGGDGNIKKLRLLAAWMPVAVAVLLGTSRWTWARPVQCAAVQLFGAFLSWINVVLFVCVHVTLGSNWSPVPEVKKEHTLTTTGPFAIARHPMYSLLFLWCAPITALASMNWVLTCATSCALIEFVTRIPHEDAILLELFGDEFEVYRQKTGALGPCFWETKQSSGDSTLSDEED